MAECNEVLREQGVRNIPRTCAVHGLADCATIRKGALKQEISRLEAALDAAYAAKGVESSGDASRGGWQRLTPSCLPARDEVALFLVSATDSTERVILGTMIFESTMFGLTAPKGVSGVMLPTGADAVVGAPNKKGGLFFTRDVKFWLRIPVLLLTRGTATDIGDSGAWTP